MAQPKQTDPQFKLRLTPDLKDAIEEAAAKNNRSMNAEIVARLELSLEEITPMQVFASQSEMITQQNATLAGFAGTIDKITELIGVHSENILDLHSAIREIHEKLFPED